jgi:tetratricopeptide (TPR) repeat protein
MFFRVVLAFWMGFGGNMTARAEGFTEGWYMMRGRANMKIGNHKAAIEAFEKVTEQNPDNREAMRTLGLAYALEGSTDKAIQQFDRYLSRFSDDPEIAFKQADYLSWSRYAFRRNDALKYLKMGLAQKEDDNMQRKLARILGQDRKDLEEALAEYRKLLSRSPNDDALRGEYRKLLIWDKKFREEAIEEFTVFAAGHPNDFEANYQLAKLLAQESGTRSEATKIYSKLAIQRPRDGKIRLEYARLLSGLSDREDDAVKEYDATLQGSNDLGVRIERADLLAKRPKTRLRALVAYKEILTKSPNNNSVRKKYAQLLLSEQADTPEGARQFELVLAQQPDDVEAHRGAAKAYARLGKNDRALDHAMRADAGEASEPRDISALKGQLGRGRERRVGMRLEGLSQPGTDYALSGIAGSVIGRTDLGPYVTAQLEIGDESYHDSSNSDQGTFINIHGQYRISETGRLNVAWGQHALGLGDNKEVYEIRVAWRIETYDLEPGVKREIRRDSLISIAGRKINGEQFGAARAEVGFVKISTRISDYKVQVTPTIGHISALSSEDNPYYGISSKVERDLWKSGEWTLGGLYTMNLEHYEKDHSGLSPSSAEPLPGGYSSPELLLYQAPQATLQCQLTESMAWSLAVGPSLQYTKTSQDGRLMVAGVDASVYLGGRIAESYDVEMAMSYIQTPVVPQRIAAAVQIQKVF